jgi:hypothetical protein
MGRGEDAQGNGREQEEGDFLHDAWQMSGRNQQAGVRTQKPLHERTSFGWVEHELENGRKTL